MTNNDLLWTTSEYGLVRDGNCHPPAQFQVSRTLSLSALEKDAIIHFQITDGGGPGDGPSTPFHHACGSIVRNKSFQHFMLGLIVVNTLMTATSTFSFVRENPIVYKVFFVVDTTFLAVFTAELVLHLYFYRWDFFSNGWLVLDFIVVVLSWAFQAITVLRSFRIIRAVRVVTHVQEIRDLVSALFKVMPSMVSIFALFLLIYFVFIVFFTELFLNAYKDGITSSDYFSRLDITAFTLLQFMLLDGWSTVTKELMTVYFWAWIPVLLFMFLCTFLVVNLLVAVICDAVQSVNKHDMALQMELIQQFSTTASVDARQYHQHTLEKLEAKITKIIKMMESLDQ